MNNVLLKRGESDIRKFYWNLVKVKKVLLKLGEIEESVTEIWWNWFKKVLFKLGKSEESFTEILRRCTGCYWNLVKVKKVLLKRIESEESATETGGKVKNVLLKLCESWESVTET
jgi:hypothetical protein